MSLLNKSTWKQKFQDFIDRVAPFDGNPLIQKAEHQELIGDDLGDSTIFREPSVSAINDPASDFGLDFNNADRFDIDTSGSGSVAFNITLSGLNDNETGILNITKKSGDVFGFANGLITPFNSVDGQAGVTALVFLVKNIGGNYIVSSGFTTLVDTGSIVDGAITNPKLAPFSVDSSNYVPLSVNGNAIDSEVVSSFKTTKAIPYFSYESGLDFNTVNTNRMIYVSNGTNAPFSAPVGVLTVIRETSGGENTLEDEVIQMFAGRGGGVDGVYYRLSSDGGSSWAGWLTVST